MASKTAAMADNNFPQARRNLLLTLKDSVKKLIPFTHKGIGKLLLNEDEQKCLKLTETIEMCLFFGMKVNEFHGSIPFYGLLSKIISNPVTTIQMQNSVDITSSSSSGRTVLARSRTWIRYALNFQILDELVEQIKNQKYELLQHFYYDRALLLSVDDLNIFIAILRSLKVLKFCFNLNSPELSMIPNWMGSSYNPSISLQPKLRGHNSDSLLTFIQKDFMDIFFTSTKTVDDENADSSYELGATGALLSLSRQMEVLGNRRPLFGTHLKDLLLDDWRCAHAYLEPRLGVPNQILKLIHFISRRLDTPGLFRKRCSNNEAMIRLRMYLEMEKGIPNGVDIYTAVQCLIQWLCELPEPLLGFQHYEALHSCYQNLNELEHRVRNVSLLVNESPWYSQPTTCQILSLFSQAIQAKHSESNKLTLSAISYIVAPTLLRVDGLTSMKSSRRQVSNDQSSNNNATRTVYEFSKSLLINSSICSPIAGFMIENEVLILDSVRSHLSEVHRNLKDKCQKILRLQNDIVKSLPKFWIGNTESVADIEGTIEDDAFESIKALWLKLEPVESRRLNTYVATTPNGSDYRVDTALQTVTRSDILRHPRWDICGFPQDAPLSNFQKYGWMMLQCLIHAVTFYEGRVHSILIEFAQKRRRYCSVCQVSTALIQFLSEFLMLISPNSETLPQIQQMSRRKSWKFIGDDHVFEELFVSKYFDILLILCVYNFFFFLL